MSAFDKLFRPAGPLGGQQLSARQLREIAADAGAAQANDIPGGGFTRTQSGTVYDVPEAAATTFSGVRAYSSQPQTIADGSFQFITFNNSVYDQGGYLDSVGNPSRLTVPGDGYYHAGANIFALPSASPYHLKSTEAQIHSYTSSGVLYRRVCALTTYVPTDAFFDYRYAEINCNGVIYLPAGHYIRIWVAVQGCDATVSPNFSNSYAEMWIHKIG